MPAEILRITSAGSVDDGKSTVLARFLLDLGKIPVDGLPAMHNLQGIADLLDGLESEREQGITIDVAHRFFDTNRRRYHLADSPGHEQYTRNMATACAGSDVLLVVVDAIAGPREQTRHHIEIALRLGIKDFIILVNKMDLVSHSKKRFDYIRSEICSLFESKAQIFKGVELHVLPVSGLLGHNIVKKSSKLSWFDGPTLFELLENVEKRTSAEKSASVAVQYVQRIGGGGRRYLGYVASGSISEGQILRKEGQQVQIINLHSSGTRVDLAGPRSAVAFELAKEIDLERGDILSSAKFSHSDLFEIDLIWLSSQKGIKGRRYLLKTSTAEVFATFTKLSRINFESNKKSGDTQSIEMNEIQRVNVALAKKIHLTEFSTAPELGRVLLIDPLSGESVAVGTVNFALRRSSNVTRQNYYVSPTMHADRFGNIPRVIWLTGLSGAGKSTIANSFSRDLHERGVPHAVLDGDNLRLGINRDLGFSEEDRTENIRRTAEIASLMIDAGLIVVVALVSPLKQDRDLAQSIIGADRFRLIYVNTALEVCEKRDPKGLYKKARAGEIPNFTGIQSKFDIPENPFAKVTEYSVELLDEWLS